MALAVCAHCGTVNSHEARFCKGGGAPVAAEPSVASADASASRAAREKSAAPGVETAEAVRRTAGEFKGLGREVQRSYDHVFGIAGPLLSVLMGFVFLIIVLLVLWAIAIAPGSRPFLSGLRDFLLTYLPVFLAPMLISSYASYSRRRYLRTYRWLSPLVAAIRIAAASRKIINRDDRDPALAAWIAFLGTSLPVILVLVLVVGYVSMSLGIVAHPERFYGLR